MPQEWLYWIPIVIVGIVAVWLVLRRKNSGKPKTPEISGPASESNLGLVLNTDENGTLQIGKLLSGVKQTDEDLLFTDPDILDPTTELPKEFHVAYEDIVPAQVIDATRTLLTIWGFIRKKGEYQAFSFASIVNQVRTRFDPLPADPRLVGGHYVPMPFSRSGLTQLLSSTTGKFLLIAGCIGFGAFFGFFVTVATGHYH